MTTSKDDLTYVKQEIVYITLIGEQLFLVVEADENTRLFRTDLIKTIVPNYTAGGSMLFLDGVDKPMAIETNPRDLLDQLYNNGDDTNETS